MNFFKSIQAKQPSPHHDDPLHHVLNNVQTNLTNLFRSQREAMNFFKSDPLHHVQTQLTNCVWSRKPLFSSNSSPLWACIFDQFNNLFDDLFDNLFNNDPRKKNLSEIKKRLNKIPVYRMTEYTSSSVLQPLTSHDGKRSAVFYFFSERDGETLVREYNKEFKKEKKNREFRLIKVSLAEIIEDWGLEFVRQGMPGIMGTRLVPDISEVTNALEERNKNGILGDSFSGVPVFQSDALRIMIDEGPNYRSSSFENTNFRSPVFFKKADLEKALGEVKKSNQGQIQVTALEDILQDMKHCSTSKWNDVVFMPPDGVRLHTASWNGEILKIAAYIILKFL